MSKPGGDPSSGISSGDVLILTERHPACRRREARLGSCTERENLHGDAKGKGTSGASCEAESTDAPVRGGLLRSSDEAGVMPVERREQAIAIWIGSTGNGRNPILNGRRQPSRDGTSRMMREYQVGLCVQRRLVCSAGDKPAGARVRSPVVWIAGWRETETLKPIDKVSLGEITSHRAVTTVNANVASKVSETEGRARNRRAKAAWGAEI